MQVQMRRCNPGAPSPSRGLSRLAARAGALLLGIVGAAMVVTACGSGGGTTISTPQGNVHIAGSPGSGGSYTIKGPHGSSQFSASSSQLPSGFPSSIPLPDGYKLLGSYGTTQASSSGWEVYLGVKGPPSAAMASYGQKLTSAGFKITEQTSSSAGAGAGGATSVVVASNGHWSVDATAVSGTSSVSGSGSLPSGYVTMTLIVASASSSS